MSLSASLRTTPKLNRHGDVKPTNVLVNSATGQVRLMGFGIASRLRRNHQPPEPPEFITGTLPYMAPEQTGQMNRLIDSRSDLYSLGVSLYEMLTGNLPSTASDPFEWVHCHIARYPAPPRERVQSVPVCVSAIVMKLIAKTPGNATRLPPAWRVISGAASLNGKRTGASRISHLASATLQIVCSFPRNCMAPACDYTARSPTSRDPLTGSTH
jgi:serine/threonine protein kinase